MESKYTYDSRNRNFVRHNVHRVTDDKHRNKFAEVTLLGFSPMNGALYEDEKGELFVESVDLSYNPKPCLFSLGYFKRLGAEVSTYALDR